VPSEQPAVGFIGLGAMGAPMVANLLNAGFPVTVASRSSGPIAAAVEAGATAAVDWTAFAQCDALLLCLPATAEVDQVLHDLLPVLHAGMVVIDCSTIDPEAERGFHELVASTGAKYLDGPLSGGTIGAKAGTLTVMVGGDADVLEAVRPVLAAVAARVFHVGGPGMGQVVKLCNNLIYAAQMVAVSEAAALAVAAGADLGALVDVLQVSTGDCVALRTRFPVPGVLEAAPASEGFRGGFATELMAKDLRLALAYAGDRRVAMSMTELSRKFCEDAVANGSAREDFSSLAKVVFRRSGLPDLDG